MSRVYYGLDHLQSNGKVFRERHSSLYFDILWYTHSIHHIHTVHSSVAIRRGSSPFTHRWSAQWEKPPWGAEPRIELGPAIQQADPLQEDQGSMYSAQLKGMIDSIQLGSCCLGCQRGQTSTASISIRRFEIQERGGPFDC